MKKFVIILGILVLHLSSPGQGLENIIVERYYISDAIDAVTNAGGTLPSGSVTYRIFVDMAPGYILQAVYGDPDYNHELRIATTTTFFNNADYGKTTGNAIPDAGLAYNTVMLDSWLSLGGASEGNMGILKQDDPNGAITNINNLLQNADPLAGIPVKTKDGLIPLTPPSISLVLLSPAINVFGTQVGSVFSTTNGMLMCTEGATGPTPDNRVLIAQLTTTGTLTFKLNLQIRRQSDSKVERWVASDPDASNNEVFCEKCTFNGVITGIDNFSIEETTDPDFKLFPNPAQNLLNIELFNGTPDSRYSYYILDMIGKLKLQSEFSAETGRYIRGIDISSFPKGAYILKLISDRGFSSAKLFIKNQ